MYKIAIILNNSPTSFMLIFKDAQKARAVHTFIEEAITASIEGADSNLICEDDHGHRMSLIASTISGSMLASIDGELDFTIDQKVLENLAQSRLSNRIQSQPKLVGGMQ